MPATPFPRGTSTIGNLTPGTQFGVGCRPELRGVWPYREAAVVMNTRSDRRQYIDSALERADYNLLSDGTISGRIASAVGVVAFGATRRDCEAELRSTFEDWLLLGLTMRHPLPIIGGIRIGGTT